MLCIHDSFETRKSHGQHIPGIVFAYTCCFHIDQYLDDITMQNYGAFETGNESVVRQHYGITCSEGVFSTFKGNFRLYCCFFMLLTKSLFLQSVLLKGTCRSVVTIKPISLKALMTLAVRPLMSGNFSENLMSMFLVQILSVPALIYQLEQMSSECISALQSQKMLQKSLILLSTEQSLKIISNSMQGTQSLALLANLVHLFHLESVENATALGYPSMTVTLTPFAQIKMCCNQFYFSVYCDASITKYSKFSGTKRRSLFSVA